MVIKDLREISTRQKQNILFLGNGINQLFNGKSCKELIQEEMKLNKLDFSYDTIEKMPFNMQIIAASNEKVDEAMERLSKKLNFNIETEHKAFLEKILELDFSTILTTNYTTELEQTLGMKNTRYGFFNCQYCTEKLTGTIKSYRLHRYSQLRDKLIWHIHGDIYAPNSIIMGNYYYGRLISKINLYLETFMRRYRFSEYRNLPFTPKSWIDYFMISDIYVLGFGMDLSESDMWYLIGAKKRLFPESKIYFYIPKEEAAEKEQLMIMLRAYNVEIVNTISKGTNYEPFYLNAILDINEKICARELLTI